jgi:hypothetical protein
MRVAEQTMYTNFTDAENTGAPMVPMLASDETDGIVADGGYADEDYRESVLSHRIQE